MISPDARSFKIDELIASILGGGGEGIRCNLPLFCEVFVIIDRILFVVFFADFLMEVLGILGLRGLDLLLDDFGMDVLDDFGMDVVVLVDDFGGINCV